MKKAISILMAILMTLALTACGTQPAENVSSGTDSSSSSSDEIILEPSESSVPESESSTTESESSTAEPETSEPEQEDITEILVTYFSCTGTTKALAEYAADGLDCDLYEITPAEPYTSADLDYGDDDSRSTREMNDPSSRPEISGSVENMEQYDVIFIGYPIWWGEAPRIISTFMESYDFSGKTVIPFCTSSSSGMGSSAANLESLTSGATWLSGRRFGGNTSRDEIVSWINELGLEVTAE